MTTRFYPLSAIHGAPTVNPPFDAAWDLTTGANRRLLWVGDVPYCPQGFSGADDLRIHETSASALNVLVVQFVSSPLTAQTISGTLKGQMRAIEAGNADADMRAQLLAKVVSNDGQTVRGTLVSLDASALSSEFTYNAAHNRKFPLAAISPVTMSSVSAQAGDRLVIEVGYRAHNTTTSDRSGGVLIEPAATTDLPEDETTTSSGRPWFEISTSPSFQAATHQMTTVLVEAIAGASSPPSRLTTVLLEVIAGAPNPPARVTSIRVEVVSEEFWHGWGVPMDTGED